MKKLLFLFVLSFCLLSKFAQAQQDSLFTLLDNAITNRPQYLKEKEFRLDSLRSILVLSQNKERKFELYNHLFNEYRHYNLDSALQVAKNKKALAFQLNNIQMQYESEMNIAEMLGKMGMYKETFDMMGRIKRADLDKSQWGYYFHIYHSIYNLLLQNALSQEEKLHYKSLMSNYKDSLLQVTNPQTLAYKLIWSGKLIESRKYTEALTIMNQCYHDYNKKEAEISTIAYGIAEVYEKTGDLTLQKKYLAISALTDVRNAVKSYIALRVLAVVLFREGGNVQRAYNYIKCAMEDASFAKARFRMIEISEALPIITATYDKKMKEEKAILFKYLVLISVLSLVLIIFIVLIYKQLKKISEGRKLIKLKNDELTDINEALRNLNKKLTEADHVKEVYIGYVFNLYSTYIDKLENYRINLYTKLKAKKIDEVLQITGSGSLVTNEVKEFFQNFDAVFLDLYPNFIDDFNKLLKDGEQIIPKAGDILTPELRVFALMRLGISDSSKIADFLHYSPQTVYNYKLKIKTKLAISKEEFLVKIQQIGNQKRF